jgi:hypothetical protein
VSDFRVEQIPRKKISWPPQERKHFGEVELAELAETIRAHGILEPIGVIRDGDGYQGLWGQRRWIAAELAGLELVPAVVRDKPRTEAEAMEIRLIENMARERERAILAQGRFANASESGRSDRPGDRSYQCAGPLSAGRRCGRIFAQRARPSCSTTFRFTSSVAGSAIPSASRAGITSRPPKPTSTRRWDFSALQKALHFLPTSTRSWRRM